jgi:hypothetical protein
MTFLWRYINLNGTKGCWLLLNCCLIGICKIGRYSDANESNHKTVRSVNVYPIYVSESWLTHQSRLKTLELTFKTLCTKTECEHTSTLSCTKVKCPSVINTYAVLWHSQHTWAVRKVSVHFKCLQNQSHYLDITWQPVRGDLTVHPCTFTLLRG